MGAEFGGGVTTTGVGAEGDDDPPPHDMSTKESAEIEEVLKNDWSISNRCIRDLKTSSQCRVITHPSIVIPSLNPSTTLVSPMDNPNSTSRVLG